MAFALVMRQVHRAFLRLIGLSERRLRTIEAGSLMGIPRASGEASGDAADGAEPGRYGFLQAAATTLRMMQHAHVLTMARMYPPARKALRLLS